LHESRQPLTRLAIARRRRAGTRFRLGTLSPLERGEGKQERFTMPRVAIIGSGLIGRAWAMVFARAGWDAAMYDAVDGVADKALGLVSEGLQELAKHGLVDDPKGSAARVRAAKSVADALDGASFVQENVPETVDAKRAIFAELDALA